MTEKPAHSPLGASSSERWLNCSGSVALIDKLTLEDTDEPEYRAAGTAAHAALAHCLEKKLDAWEVAGLKFNDIEVDEEMASAVQVFLDVARPLMEPAAGYSPGHPYIEYPMAAEQFHPLFYGTVDFGIVATDHGETNTNILSVLDFKYGEGVVVEVQDNPQVMYYAFGLLLLHPEVDFVRTTIVQPRIPWHPDGVVRTAEYEADYIRQWANDILLPGMKATATNSALLPGDWCRFCPAKLICPALTHLFGAAAKADPREIVEFDDATLDRNYPLIAAIKNYIKALEAEAYSRLQHGHEFGNLKLVKKKADRVYKPGSDVVFKSRFGDEAFTAPELKSPAQMTLISSLAKELVNEYAYSPDTGTTVALKTDKRHEVKVQSTAEAFPGATAGDK